MQHERKKQNRWQEKTPACQKVRTLQHEREYFTLSTCGMYLVFHDCVCRPNTSFHPKKRLSLKVFLGQTRRSLPHLSFFSSRVNKTEPSNLRENKMIPDLGFKIKGVVTMARKHVQTWHVCFLQSLSDSTALLGLYCGTRLQMSV